MADKARHAFGTLENIDTALANGVIDEFDILFVKDANGNPYVGWVDKDKNKVILQDKVQIVRVTELPAENGDENVVYIFNNEGYIWNTVESKCVPLAKSENLTTLETQISNIETQMSNKVDVDTVQTMIEEHSDSAIEIIEF